MVLIAVLVSLRQVLPQRGEVVDHGNQLGAPSIEDTITITKSREKPYGSCEPSHAPAPRCPRCTIVMRVVLMRNPKAGPPNASGSRLHQRPSDLRKATRGNQQSLMLTALALLSLVLPARQYFAPTTALLSLPMLRLLTRGSQTPSLQHSHAFHLSNFSACGKTTSCLWI